jgi:hypothetical protein
MSQSEMVNTDQYTLTIPNPDSTFAPPIYTGPAENVHQFLIPGTYKAIIENWTTDRSSDVTVYVKDNSTVLGRFAMVGENA